MTTTTTHHTAAGSDSFDFGRHLSLAEKLALVNQVSILEGRLFDGQGHIRRGVSRDSAVEQLGEINIVRHDLGWLDLDLEHRLVWPTDVPIIPLGSHRCRPRIAIRLARPAA